MSTTLASCMGFFSSSGDGTFTISDRVMIFFVLLLIFSIKYFVFSYKMRICFFLSSLRDSEVIVLRADSETSHADQHPPSRLSRSGGSLNRPLMSSQSYASVMNQQEV